MRIYHDLAALPHDFGPTVLSIGNFDGVHRAHQHVLSENIRRARELGAISMVVTFDPHPVRILRPEVPKRLITPLPIKLRLLQQLGFDAVLVLTFNRDLSLLSPRAFAEEILVQRLRVKEVHEGSNFHFGRNQEGTVAQLAEFGREMGFEVNIYPQRYYRRDHVSSSRIRELVAGGDVRRARALLARPFSILGTPGRGRGYGHRYTVPTINLSRYDELVPAHGVYITTTRVVNRTATGTDDETFESVTNVGMRPTFENESFAIETHLLNFHPITLQPDTEVQLAFLHRLRAEIKFPSVDDLRAQIAKDVHQARRYFHLARVLSSDKRR
jgi:riboflavin kinase/FMN adenylyltransferase